MLWGDAEVAISPDPLRRDQIGVVARDTGARYEAPTSNRALELARSLGDLLPEARGAALAVAAGMQEKQEANARRDAVVAQGARLADAVREGRLEATQNPWYTQAYNRESAAIRGDRELRALQTQAASWDTRDDPAAFERQWREGVAAIAEGMGDDQDTSNGFAAVERQVTQQVLAANQSANVARIEAERVANLSALAAQSLADASRRGGGSISPNGAHGALEAARTQWFATGGSQEQWNRIMVQAVTSAAYSTRNPSLLDLLRSPELINGPSPEGELAGPPQAAIPAVDPNAARPDPAPVVAEAVEAPPAGEVPGRSYLPVVGPVTGVYGERRHRSGGGYRNHGGIDLAVPVGTAIRAPSVTGRVVAVREGGNGGRRVTVGYGNGVELTYMHLSRVDVAEGDLVQPGQLLALSGGRRGTPGAGNSTGPHLHYQAKQNGRTVDPRAITLASVDGSPAPGTTPPPDLPDLPDPAGTTRPGYADVISRGPSLYDMAGVAADAEAARYRISSALSQESEDRIRAITGERRLQGLQQADRLWAAYGTRLLTGDFDTRTIIRQLQDEGVSPQVISEALGAIRSEATSSLSLQQAQMNLNGTNPNESRRLMDLRVRGIRDGHSAQYEEEVGQEVLAGNITGDEGAQWIASSIARSESEEADARAEARASAQQGGAVRNYAQLRATAQNLASNFIIQAYQAGVRVRDSGHEHRYATATITRVMQAHLAQHPGDWDGAVMAGRNAAARLLQRNLQRRQDWLEGRGGGAPRNTPSPAAISGTSNPRRGN